MRFLKYFKYEWKNITVSRFDYAYYRVALLLLTCLMDGIFFSEKLSLK
jgi:hypothetical protein